MRITFKPRRVAGGAVAAGLMLFGSPVGYAAPPAVGPVAGPSAAETVALQNVLGGGGIASLVGAPVGQPVPNAMGAMAAEPMGRAPGGLATYLGLPGFGPGTSMLAPRQRVPVVGALQQALALAGFPGGAQAVSGPVGVQTFQFVQGLGGLGGALLGAGSAGAVDPLDAAAVHLAVGSTGPAVVVLQNTLKDWNLVSPVDGRFTEATAALVTDASTRAGVPLGDLPTRLAFIGFGPQAPALMPGGRGPQVAALQRALSRAGFPVGATGRFGPETEGQVQAFQVAHGLQTTSRITLWQVERVAVEATAPKANQGSAAGGPAVAFARSEAQAVGDPAAALTALARELVGDRYAWGGNGPWAFDCSGLVRYVFQRAAGIWLPHSTYIQWLYGRAVSEGQLVPGDLVFFDTDGPGPSHVGIYVGGADRAFIDAANPELGVRVDTLEDAYWARHFIGGRRIL